MGVPSGTPKLPDGNEGRFVTGDGKGVASIKDVAVTVTVGRL